MPYMLERKHLHGRRCLDTENVCWLPHCLLFWDVFILLGQQAFFMLFDGKLGGLLI